MGDCPAGGRLGTEGGEGGGEIKERIDTHHTCKCINHTGSHEKLKPSQFVGSEVIRVACSYGVSKCFDTLICAQSKGYFPPHKLLAIGMF